MTKLRTTLFHLKANYGTVNEEITHGHYLRSSFVRELVRAILLSVGAEVNGFRVRIQHPNIKSPTKDDMILLPVSGKEIFRIGLSKLGLGKTTIPRVEYRLLSKFLSDTAAVAMIDDFSTVKMLGYEGLDFILDRGVLIYVSHNFYELQEKDRKIEAYMMKRAFLSIVATERDRYLYRQRYGLDDVRVLVYPNIYPLRLPPDRPENMNIGLEKHSRTTVVLNMGSKVSDSVCRSFVRTVHRATSEINSDNSLRLLIIGDNLVRYARGLNWRHEVEFQSHLPDRRLFLEKLSTAHIGINYAYKAVGSNIKKYDYALAGLAVLSNTYGCKGEILPREWVFYDEADLYVKLTNLLDEDLGRLGVENREHALARAQKHYENLRQKLSSLL